MFLLSQLFLSNYSLAIGFNDWRAEKIFPRAVLITCLQVYFLVGSGLLLFFPKVRTQQELIQFAIVLGGLTVFILLIFRLAVIWIYYKLQIISRFRQRNKGEIKPVLGVATFIVAVLAFLGAAGWRLFLFTNG